MNKKKKLPFLAKLCIFIALAALVFGGIFAVQTFNNKATVDPTIEEMQLLVEQSIRGLPKSVSRAKQVATDMEIQVVDVKKGTNKEIIATCKYTTKDIGSVIEENLDEYLTLEYNHYLDKTNKGNGKSPSATDFMAVLIKATTEDMEGAKTVSGEVDFLFYEVKEGELTPYYSDEVINAFYGGLLDAFKVVDKQNILNYNGEEVDISTLYTLRTGIKQSFELQNYVDDKPDTSIPLVKWLNELKSEFVRNFIHKDQYMYIVNGLITTLEITLCAVLLGIAIGFVVAVIRVTNQKTGKLGIASSICKGYLSVMRGTPVMVQLLIVYFVVLLPIGVEKFPAAVLCFGLNSGAYVSEIVRGGIVSVDPGQMEAGRSLGFNYIQTMWHIIIPQAFKAVLPSLANEFITLLKESSVAFYIGVADLTQGGLKIRSITYSNFMPLIAVAVIYLILVLGLTKCVGVLERRLQKGDKG